MTEHGITHLIAGYNFSVTIAITLPTPLMLHSLILSMNGNTHLKPPQNDFSWQFYLLQSFWKKSAERNLPKAVQGPPNAFFLLENTLIKLVNIFLNSFFYLKVQFFRLIMKNNFFQMVASAGHTVAYTIGPIFKHIINYVQLYLNNGFTNIVL